MRTIYVNNFRGFSETYMDLLDVNFLVGENSSGKTSLLWAIRLLNDPAFLFSLDFNATGPGLGHFKDLVSVGAKDRSFFELGLINTHTPNNSSKRSPSSEASSFSAILLKFVDKNGQPDLTECTYQRNATWVHLKIRNRRAAIGVVQDAATSVKSNRIFESWDYLTGSPSMKLHPIAMKFGHSFLFALADAVRQYGKKYKKALGENELPDVYQTIRQMQDDLTWIAPIRTKPKRTYDQYSGDFSEEGEHTPYLIKRILSQKKYGLSFDKYLRKVGKASGLFESIGIHRYGRGPTAPFELDVDLGAGKVGINNVGYGVSQSLPILVELHAQSPDSAFAIQQPEVHLHPKAQAALGEVIFDAAASEAKRFVIETHSDYLMDRFRMKMKGANKRMNAQIVFFEHVENGNRAHQLLLAEDGKLPEVQPVGYRQFFVNEALDSLELG